MGQMGRGNAAEVARMVLLLMFAGGAVAIDLAPDLQCAACRYLCRGAHVRVAGESASWPGLSESSRIHLVVKSMYRTCHDLPERVARWGAEGHRLYSDYSRLSSDALDEYENLEATQLVKDELESTCKQLLVEFGRDAGEIYAKHLRPPPMGAIEREICLSMSGVCTEEFLFDIDEEDTEDEDYDEDWEEYEDGSGGQDAHEEEDGVAGTDSGEDDGVDNGDQDSDNSPIVGSATTAGGAGAEDWTGAGGTAGDEIARTGSGDIQGGSYKASVMAGRGGLSFDQDSDDDEVYVHDSDELTPEEQEAENGDDGYGSIPDGHYYVHEYLHGEL